MKNIIFTACLLISFGFVAFSQPKFSLLSPDKHINLQVHIGDFIEFEVAYDSIKIVEPTRISLKISNELVLGLQPKVRKKINQTISRTIVPVVPEKFKTIPDHFNEMELKFKRDYSILFRVYNHGVAYRFITRMNDPEITIQHETMILKFPDNSNIWFPEEDSYHSHNERYYTKEQISLISSDRFCSLPALVETPTGFNVLVSESSLEDYPGMWLRGTGMNSLRADFPGVALEEEQTNDRNVKVSRRAEYLAVTKGNRAFPWRMLAVASDDKSLITNSLAYLLADTCMIKNTKWIKPGKVAWDWWNACNLYGVDFEAGVNTETYKYYIDFAAENNIEYIIMDEGWYELGDLLKVVPEIEMQEILNHAEKREVGVILWVVWKTLEDQWQVAFDQFEAWGIKGIKVDFMQRDDQWMVNYYERVASEAAKRKLLVDFHGSYKPSGLRRKYPNVLTREGLRGLEQSKWSEKQTPDHNLVLPFIRMVAGPMDYTPGAMINANPSNFYSVFTRPMSIGTRCHQLAMYVVYESPLQMLCDSPSNYKKEPECMQFLSEVPTVWDTTIVLHAKIGDHIVLARKMNDTWYMGAMCNSEKHEFEVSLNFLDEGTYHCEIWKDGVNADRNASDFKFTTETHTNREKLNIELAPGGGWVAKITSQNKM